MNKLWVELITYPFTSYNQIKTYWCIPGRLDCQLVGMWIRLIMSIH